MINILYIGSEKMLFETETEIRKNLYELGKKLFKEGE